MATSETQESNLFECSICGRIIALRQGARSHVARKHGVSDTAARIEPVFDH